MLVRFTDVSKAYGAFEVLDRISFQINAGEKLALIGANGAGKTTLLHLIETPDDTDSGRVVHTSGLRLGRLDQHIEFGSDTVLDEAQRSFSPLRTMERTLRDLELRMETDQDPAILERYADLQHSFEQAGGYTYRARAESALFGLGFRRHQLGQIASSLSGGEKNRLALAALLLKDTDLILLDEPTNHLDIRSIEWLEGFLSATGKALLIVSHDRLFIDRVATRTLELERGKLYQYKGNYTVSLKQREERTERQWREWKKQQEWISRTEDYIRRNIAGQNTRQAQARRNALSRMKRIDKPLPPFPAVQFRFGETPRSRRQVIRTEQLAFGYTAEAPLAGVLNLEIERGQRWAILGPNGSGKTTLLATLSGRRDALAGTVECNETRIGFYDQELKGLNLNGSVLTEMRDLDAKVEDGQLRSFLAGFLFQGDAVDKRVRDLSGGERSRLALAKLIYTTPPLLALDEPTNHLDIASREALEAALSQYPGTLVFVTHDRRLVDRVATHILYLASDAVRTFDSFLELEAWLSEDIGKSPAPRRSAPQGVKPNRELGKNRREHLEKEIAHLEVAITKAESELQKIETGFQQPPPDFEWDTANRRYRGLKEEVETLYHQLAERLEMIE